MRSPLGNAHREENIKAQSRQGNPSKPSIKLHGQNGEHQGHLNQGGHDAVQRIGDERLNAAHAALNVTRHAARLTGQVKSQAQRMQMLKGFKCNAARCTLRGFGKYQFSQFAKRRGHEPECAIAHQQCRWHHQDLRWIAGLKTHGIDQSFKQDWHTHIGQFGAYHEGQSSRHAPLVGHQVGKQSFKSFAV